jgi:aldehyde:ferredoxin oxidoreductase
MGAVMGSKNLKAIAVRGHQKVALPDDTAAGSLARWFRDFLKTNRYAISMSKDGTAGALSVLSAVGGITLT